MPRRLDFPIFDADNHMYEPPEAMTKYLPEEYAGVIQYVQVKGRTKIAVKGQISDYIPNPTFEVVAAPGAQEEYFKTGNPEGKSKRETFGRPIKALPAFFEPAPRLALMDELGIDRAMMWPTLASLVEERLADDPLATHAVIHALNQWMHETWSFDYQGRIFATPIITLPIVERAIEELEWVLARGARAILVRPAPVSSYGGRRSPALPEFDPFWRRVEAAGIMVGMHASDSGYTRYLNDWEGIRDKEFQPFKGLSGFSAIVSGEHRPIVDTMASLIGHGLCSRFPRLQFAPIENGSHWVRPLLRNMEHAYKFSPGSFAENPVDVFLRQINVHPFHEEDPVGLVKLLGADRVLFGSDFPHPEGLADPVAFVDELSALPAADVAKVMGGNLGRLMKTPAQKAAA
jgi:predicted TIM-barrel fold metal-dependent hydrolase